MLRVAVGQSEQVVVSDILGEIVDQCDRALGDSPPKAGLLFVSSDINCGELLSGIQKKWPGLSLVGCTTDGEISSRNGFVDDSVLLILFSSDTIEISTGIGKGLSTDVSKAVRQSVAQATKGMTHKPSMYVIFPAGMKVSGDAIVGAFREVVGEDVALFGASAAPLFKENVGDEWRFDETLQFCDGEVVKDAVSVMAFSGPLIFSAGIDCGWKGIGIAGQVSRSDGHVVHEIDGKPALDYFQEFLGKGVSPSGHCPFALLDANGKISRLRASIGMFDKESCSMTFLGDVPVGSSVQVTMADRDQILNGAYFSVTAARESFPKNTLPQAALVFSCSGRKVLLGTRVSEEYEIIRRELGDEISIAGFYAYGEFGPAMNSVHGCEFHNQTFVTILFGTER